jgi:betaine-aldehyde dehydrogenase
MVAALADLITSHADELALLDVRDNGSPIREMRRDAFAAAGTLRYFAGFALELKGDTIPSDAGRLNYTVLEPFGVVGKIIPFNHPFMFAVAKSRAPLVAGNTVIIKPSEHTSLSAPRLGELAAEIFPPGVPNVVTGYGGEAGDAVVTHPGIRRLGFTGSAEIGRSIQQRAAASVVKTVTLELGGRSRARDELHVARAVMRFHVAASRARLDPTGVRERAHQPDRGAAPGNARGREHGNRRHRAPASVREGAQVPGHWSAGGARVLVGGGKPADPALQRGVFIEPTVFDGVAPGSRLAQEEIFGPVLAVMGFRDYEEGVAIANDVRFRLTASIFTRDLGLAHRFAADIEAGYVWVNDTSNALPRRPVRRVQGLGGGTRESLEELHAYTRRSRTSTYVSAELLSAAAQRG